MMIESVIHDSKRKNDAFLKLIISPGKQKTYQMENKRKYDSVLKQFSEKVDIKNNCYMSRWKKISFRLKGEILKENIQRKIKIERHLPQSDHQKSKTDKKRYSQTEF